MKYRKKKKNTKDNKKNVYTLIKMGDEEVENIKPAKNDINIGVQILRVIYCFLVVVVHFGSGEIYAFSWKYIDFYATSFFLIAFYYSYHTFSSRHIPKIKERFLRLLYPYILVPIIVYVRNNFYTIKLSGILDRTLLKRFYIQYLLGNNIHGIM